MTTLVRRTAERRSPLERRGPRLFATPADEPRARRATDLLLLAGAAIGSAVVGAFATPPPAFARAVSRFLAAFPAFFDGVWELVIDSFALLAIVFVVAAAIRRRWSIVRDIALAICVAVFVWLAVGRGVEGAWPDVWHGLRAYRPPPWYPSPRVAVPAAVVMTVSPHVTLPIRRLGRWLTLLALVAVTALGATRPLGAIAGLLIATIASSTIHLAFGSSGGRPGLDLVLHALNELRVRTVTLGAADRQQAGLFLVNATSELGEPLIVKVYGRDAHDAALVSTLWRTVWFREAGSPLRFRRLEQVEHEAFLTLFAGQAGIRTDTVVTAGTTAEDDALLVLRRNGVPLTDRTDHHGATTVLRVWDTLTRLHKAGIAHGQFDDRHLAVHGDEIGLLDFRGATVTPTETQLRTDEVQALVATVLLVGEEAATEAARDALGRDGLAAALPFLQAPALTQVQRQQVRGAGLDLDRLRGTAGELIGAETPPLQQLRRVTLGTLVKVVLPAIAVVALVSGLAGLDFTVLGEELSDAAWWLAITGVIVTQLPRLSQAVSTLGASPVPLPLGPVYALQLAVSYINIAVPTTAARIAVNIRFFQRHGVPPGSALAAGALDGFSGFIVQIALLVCLLLFTPASVDLRLDNAADAAWRLLLAVAVAVAAAVLVVALVARLRRFIIGWARRLGTEALGALRGLHSPRRLGLLFGGNFATEVVFAVALGVFARAFGFPIGIAELLLINISVALLSGLIPVPGGIGVAEGALTLGLVRAGMPEESAFAAVLMYRLSSFYLPPVWGFFALRWLERNKHL